MDEDLQHRAVESAMRHPGVAEGDLEGRWDEVWLALGEEFGWQNAPRSMLPTTGLGSASQ